MGFWDYPGNFSDEHVRAHRIVVRPGGDGLTETGGPVYKDLSDKHIPEFFHSISLLVENVFVVLKKAFLDEDPGFMGACMSIRCDPRSQRGKVSESCYRAQAK
mgnify:CR=1 FL=1